MTSPGHKVTQMLEDYFSAFAQGMDVPPARRFFIEGYLQALVDVGELTLDEASALVEKVCCSHLGDSAAAPYRDSTPSGGPITLHSHTLRAPVFPGG
mgnify:CR=1 FL=1